MTAGHVIVVGGGASGVILAAHLLRASDRRLRVTLVERRAEIGQGVAYATTEPDHILNTRAGSMSAFADDGEHFWRWLLQSEAADDIRCSDPFCFVPRRHYAAYLADLVKPWRADTGDGRLSVVRGTCTAMRTTPTGVAVEVGGATHIGHCAVLATGHQVPEFAANSPYVDAWTTPEAAGIRPEDAVLILGTGLSMVDTVIQLAGRGHRGSITALSRRGQLPRVHRRNAPLRIDIADMPLGTDISYILRWFRRTAAWATERGGDWRDVVDGVRPHTATLWRSLTPAARSRFLRHARTWWEVHRHRLPPESETRILAAIATGRLDLVAGRFVDLERHGDAIRVTYRRRGSVEVATMSVARVIDCTGILRDPRSNPAGLLSHLIADGLVRPDPLNIGIEVDDDGAVVGRSGASSSRIFAVGPVTRARDWEMTAVPDIRVQCAVLAQRITAALSAPSTS
ncbi:hypothetical protein ASG43_08645 [Aureimonas sp. Leaf454]|uniref:FAD/NAD(P)-binding protein n=1 Tax=Aureimonas sp. Leaf454 TaxID=1736381 RepID=UPI0006FEE73F|nr:FAD/NAD(P)-binding protein [Aureimonas sp. Leaf454]KQT48899.1 hypothetical protein ASG43_08645 [Aureimonas sp. Leaf454]